jgi:hypothetical protein
MKGKSERGKTVIAQVFLRSVSGRTLSELGEAPLPDDMSPFRPPPAARQAVHRFLAEAGLKVFGDEAGLTLSIEGTPAQFAKTFGIEAARVAGVKAHRTVTLGVPAEIQSFVDRIVVTPKPEFY